MSEPAPNTTESSTQRNARHASGNPEVDMFRQRLARSAHDVEAWLGLVNYAKHVGDDALLHETYTDALKQYPSCGQLLASLAELELRRGNIQSAETIFNSSLFNVPSIELWQCYLNYVLKANVDAQGVVSQPERRAIVKQCYKLVLDNVGCDREAGRIWADYIGFLSSGQTNAPYEEQQKTELLRETFQAAVAIPHLKVEEIWKNYDGFENRLDRATAKQMLSRTSPSYMTARTALRAMNRHWDAIRRHQPLHGIPAPPEWSSREIDYLDAWKKYLKWEMENPLNINDAGALRRRVVFAYNQACMALRFYPEIWIDFAEYLSSQDQHSDALAKMHSASLVLPSSLAVQFAYAEMAEKHKQPNVCKQVYEKVVVLTRADIDSTKARYTQKLDRLEKRLAQIAAKKKASDDKQEMQNAEAPAEAPLADSSSDSDSDESDSIGDDSGMDGNASDASGRERDATTVAMERAKRRTNVHVVRTKARMEQDLCEVREPYTLAWIMYLRYVQRAEGIDAVRQLLRRPRSDPPGYLTYHLFVSAAQMEYHVAKKPGIAAKLFEFYSKMFSDQPAYIVEYLGYLINSGDDTNARALFERFQGTSTGDSGDIWSTFAEFEYNYGDLSAISKLDKRFIEKFEHESVLTRLAARYSYLDVDTVAVRDFGFPYRKDHRSDAPGHGGLRRLGDDDADSGNELAAIAVGSVTGRHLRKEQLLAPVTPKRFVRFNTSALEEYDPVIEDYETPEPMSASYAGGGSGVSTNEARPAMSPSTPSTIQFLEQGDVLSYVAAAVSNVDLQNFGSRALDVDALLDAILQTRSIGQQQGQSSYRPLAYMSRQASHGGPPSRPVGRGRMSRSRSKGYSEYDDRHSDRRSFGSTRKSPHRGSFRRQPPYSRNSSGGGYPARSGGYDSRRGNRGGYRDDNGY
ncbi:mRNA 3'-end-processing protein rna14 [Coemansia sp. RSA 2050]|nr:mRNA 3'-end-processing protein rna14 [Coemansia sp. RSA 2050]